MTTYERVTFRDGDRARTVRLRNPQVSAGFLSGTEVKPDGDEVVPAGHTERLRVIGLDLVTKRTPLEFDLKYAILVPSTQGA